MKYQDVADAYKLPLNVLYVLRAKGILFSDHELCDEEIVMLKGIAQIWGSEYFLRKQLARISKQRREKIIQSPELTKPERFMFNRFLKAKQTGEPGELSVHQVASEAMTFLRIPDDAKTTLKMVKIARRMRQKSYYELRKKRKNGTES